jgi:hypothetical protein
MFPLPNDASTAAGRYRQLCQAKTLVQANNFIIVIKIGCWSGIWQFAKLRAQRLIFLSSVDRAFPIETLPVYFHVKMVFTPTPLGNEDEVLCSDYKILDHCPKKVAVTQFWWCFYIHYVHPLVKPCPISFILYINIFCSILVLSLHLPDTLSYLCISILISQSELWIVKGVRLFWIVLPCPYHS